MVAEKTAKKTKDEYIRECKNETTMTAFEVRVIGETVGLFNISTDKPTTDAFIIELYANLVQCFPSVVDAAASHKEASLIVMTDGTKQLTPILAKLRKRAFGVIDGPNDSQFRQDDVTDYFLKRNNYKFFVLQAKDGTIKASCRVHYDNAAVPPTREIHDVCSRMPKCCFILIPSVVKFILDKAEESVVKIYCVSKNERACECYRAVAEQVRQQYGAEVVMETGKDESNTYFTFRAAGPKGV